MYIHLQIDLYLSISDDEIIGKHAQLVKKIKKKTAQRQRASTKRKLKKGKEEEGEEEKEKEKKY